MDVVHLVLYLAASFAALRSLISMMSSHKARYATKRLAEVAQQKTAMAAAPPAAPPAKPGRADRTAA